MNDNHEGGEHRLRELPPELFELAVDEWHSRTTWGKIVYPFWFAFTAFQWLLPLTILGAIIVIQWYSRAMDEMWENVKGLGPETHKNGGQDSDR